MSLIRLGILMIIVVMKSHSQPIDSIPENAKKRLREILPGFSAYGFDLAGMSGNPNILLANRNSVVVKYSDELYYLITTYDFDSDAPDVLKLKNQFDKIKVVMIRHSLETTNSDAPYHKIPHWLKNFKKMECLILDNADLESEEELKEHPLKLLGIQNAVTKDTRKLRESISKISSLEFLIYNSVFSSRDVEELKLQLPLLTTIQLKP